MAEGEKESNVGWNAGSWFNGFISAAKEQTEKVFEVVSNDLVEFTSTMQQDTKTVVEKTKETLQQTNESKTAKSTSDMMKQSFHSFMSGITKALTVDPDDDAPSPRRVPQETTELFDRAKARLRAVQVDTGTYLNEPTGPEEKYADWLKSFDIESRKGEISDLLVTMVEVRSLYTSLVPSEVSHQDFWRRYFYKLHQLEVDEARKQALMKRAERAHTKEDSVGWDEEEWSGDESPKYSPNKQDDSATTQAETTKPDEIESRLAPDTDKQTESSTKYDSDKNTDSNKVENTQQTHTEAKPQSHVKQKEPDNSNDTVKLPDTQGMDNDKVNTDEKAKAVIHEGKDTESCATGSDAVSDDSKDASINEAVTKTEKELEIDPKPTKNEPSKKSEMKDIKLDAVKQDCDKDETSEPSVKSEDEGKVDVKDGKAGPAVKDVTVNNTERQLKTDKDVTVDNTDRQLKTDKDVTMDNPDRQLKTKVKGDMIVVGDRESPSSDSSGNKESLTEDWEQDFDVEITPEDLAAASELAQKMNMSASDYSKITGEEDDDWENWD